MPCGSSPTHLKVETSLVLAERSEAMPAVPLLSVVKVQVPFAPGASVSVALPIGEPFCNTRYCAVNAGTGGTAIAAVQNTASVVVAMRAAKARKECMAVDGSRRSAQPAAPRLNADLTLRSGFRHRQVAAAPRAPDRGTGPCRRARRLRRALSHRRR